MLLIAYMKADEIPYLNVYALFMKKFRESKILTVICFLFELTVSFDSRNSVKKCLNISIKNFISFHMSYQQHASEHGNANGDVLKFPID